MFDLVFIMIAHYISDFLFQSRNMAIKKSEELPVLVYHGVIIVVGVGVGCWLVDLSPWVAVINSIIHMVVDWFIWKGYKQGKGKDFRYWNDRGFYNIIGLDQLLHYITLVLLWDYFN